ncbi:hypothetical protein F5Y15DRAFT_36527 [Xylariaceae sp. FL0016]|nr:hypothetical protein F5Y15DRAFT_36527 [Xylariaceae sp. FL0016]
MLQPLMITPSSPKMPRQYFTLALASLPLCVLVSALTHDVSVDFQLYQEGCSSTAAVEPSPDLRRHSLTKRTSKARPVKDGQIQSEWLFLSNMIRCTSSSHGLSPVSYSSQRPPPPPSLYHSSLLSLHLSSSPPFPPSSNPLPLHALDEPTAEDPDLGRLLLLRRGRLGPGPRPGLRPHRRCQRHQQLRPSTPNPLRRRILQPDLRRGQ